MTSALLKRGISYLDTLATELLVWMGEHEYDSIKQMQGSMSRNAVPQPTAFERANYMKVLSSVRHAGGDLVSPLRTCELPLSSGRSILGFAAGRYFAPAHSSRSLTGPTERRLPYAVSASVPRQQDQLFHLCLRHQHTVERIAMMPRQQRNLPGVRSQQRKALEGFGGQPLCKVGRQPQFAQALLQPDLPERDGANEDRVLRVRDQLPGLRGESRAIRQPPEQDVGIQQDSQRGVSLSPKTSAISSGSSSKSPAI